MVIKLHGSRSRQEMRESSFEIQITNLNKEKSALRSQLDQTLDDLKEVSGFCFFSQHELRFQAMKYLVCHGSGRYSSSLIRPRRNVPYFGILHASILLSLGSAHEFYSFSVGRPVIH